MNWRSMGLALALLLGGAGAAAGQIEGSAVTGFRLPEYDEDGNLTQLLYGETATFLPDNIVELTGLKIELYRQGAVYLRATASQCALDSARGRAASRQHIRIVTDKSVLTGDGFAWNRENQQFQIFQNVKVTLDAQMDQGELLKPQPAAKKE